MTLEKVIKLKKYNLKVIGRNAPSNSTKKGTIVHRRKDFEIVNVRTALC